MSDVSPTMKFVDHKTPATINVDTIKFPESDNQPIITLVDRFLERQEKFEHVLSEFIKKPNVAPIVNVSSPEINLPKSLEMPAPVLHAQMPSIEIPAPQVQVSVNLFSRPFAAIIIAIMLLQLITVGVTLWP